MPDGNEITPLESAACSTDLLFEIQLNVAAGQEYPPRTGRAHQSDISTEAGDRPRMAAAGMLFFQGEGIADMEFYHVCCRVK